jgi:hypothetical protein
MKGNPKRTLSSEEGAPGVHFHTLEALAGQSRHQSEAKNGPVFRSKS